MVASGSEKGALDSSRLNDPDDFVRKEIEAAFRQGTFVIPILAHNAQFPAVHALPGSLRGLVRRNYRKISHERFHADVDQLIDEIRVTIGHLRKSKMDDPDSIAKVAVVPLLGSVASGKTSLLAALRQAIDVGTGYTSAADVTLIEEVSAKTNKLQHDGVLSDMEIRTLGELQEGIFAAAQLHLAATLDNIYVYPELIRFRRRKNRSFSYRQMAILDSGGGLMLPSRVHEAAYQSEITQHRRNSYMNVLRQVKGLVVCIDVLREFLGETFESEGSDLSELFMQNRGSLERVAVAFTKMDLLMAHLGGDAAARSLNKAAIGSILKASLTDTRKSRLRELENMLRRNSATEMRCFPTSAFGFIRQTGVTNFDVATGNMVTTSRDWMPFLVADPFIYAAIGDVSDHGYSFTLDELM